MSDLRRFAELYHEAAQDASAATATTFEVDDSPQRHARYQRRFVRLTVCSGVVGVLLGLVLCVIQCAQGEPRCVEGFLRVPPMFGVIGACLALAVGCLMVPGDFLRSPYGQRWMQLIGVESVAAARIVCLLFVLIITLPIVALVALILLQQP
jgi:hypothetical protein